MGKYKKICLWVEEILMVAICLVVWARSAHFALHTCDSSLEGK